MPSPDRPQEPVQGEPLDALEWARTVEPPRPLTVGEIEAEVLRRPIPPRPPLSVGARFGQVIGFAFLIPLSIAVLCAPLVGAGIVLAHAASLDPTITRDLLPLGRLAFVVAAVVPILVLGFQWVGRGRGRRWWGVLAAAVVALLAVASGVAAVVSGATDLEVGFVVWIGVAVVTSVGALVVILVDSRKPEPPRVPHDPVAARFVQVREQVLRVLMERRLAAVADPAEADRIAELPRGAWIERERAHGVG